MTDLAKWQENNARQLAAYIAKLRERLENYSNRAARLPVGKSSSSAPTVPPDVATPNPKGKTVSRSLIQRLLREQPTKVETESSLASEVAPSESKETITEPVESTCALDVLTKRLQLSPFERDVLLLCAAVELDTRISGLCARAQDDPHRSFPTFALALALFDDASWDALSPDRPLRFWRLVDIHQTGAQPLTSSALRTDDRIVSYLKGLNYLDERITSFLVPLELDGKAADLSESQRRVVDAIVRRLNLTATQGPLPVLQLVGSDPISKQLVARAVAAQLATSLCRMPVELLPAAPGDLESLARLWQRESLLMPLALFLDGDELDGNAVERVGALDRFLSRTQGLLFLSVREVLPRVGTAQAVVDIAKPNVAEQEAAWAEVLGEHAAGEGAKLAAQFSFNLPTIQYLGRLAKSEAGEAVATMPKNSWELCCASERPRLDLLAQRLEPKMTWRDLILPNTETALLKRISAQVGQRNKVYNTWGFARKMNRGFGISALFAGDSGTGKTMAAEVIANELHLNLYRIDLSAVVNKYIGETEKNLRRLFDAAEEGGAILFFDEADALFGKRSEVKDSHDRYANIEINYLLQRIESYRGLAILATNMRGALDTAFLRRLRFVVNFPFPGIPERRRLWEKVFLQEDLKEKLPAPPLDHLDYERLARLNLSGGHIHNVALNAAFTAAERDVAVSMSLILEAARAEFIKLDRPINEAEFRWVEPLSTVSKPAKPDEPVLV